VACVSLAPIHVEHRTDHRRPHRFCAAGRTWKFPVAASSPGYRWGR